MRNNIINFNHSEEAFVQSSLNEVIKIWESGFGQASFRLDVCEGSGTLNLSFQLGKPSDKHCDLGVPAQPGSHVNAYPQQQHRRRKGPARHEKDRARAAAHQARIQSESQVAVHVNPTLANTACTESNCRTDTSENLATVPAAIKLPFNGNLLPLQKTPLATSSVASVATSAVSPTPSSYSVAVSAAPIKGNKRSKYYDDANSAKKKLFSPNQSSSQSSLKSIPLQIPANPSVKTKTNKAGFKNKENELFLKLFS